MLSGDDNETRQQKNNLHCSTLFWFMSLPLFCTTITKLKLPSYNPFYTFYGENVVHVCAPVPFFFFSLPLIFTLVAAIKFFVFFPTKLVSFVFCLSLQPFIYYPRQLGHRLLTCGRFSQNQKPNFLTNGTPLLKC